MNAYCFIIKFNTPIGTPLKGDTLFGHICWQIAYDSRLFNASLDELLSEYDHEPFCVVSSGFPVIKHNHKYQFLFKTPSLPLNMLFELQIKSVSEAITERKRFKKKRWMILEGSKGYLKRARFFSDKEILKKFFSLESKSLIKEISSVHNTLQRTTFSTAAERFAPYSVNNYWHHPDMFAGIVVCCLEKYLEPIKKVMERIGRMGFGRDASSGLGKFELIETIPFDIKSLGSENPQALYTLGPSVIEPDEFKDYYFFPFVRYGRHGDYLAKSKNPFKNPVVMLDEGAILMPKSEKAFQLPYTGKSIKGVSLSFEKTVHQGYSPYIPVRLEGSHV